MPKMKLTEKVVKGLSAVPGKPVLYWDTKLPGFGVAVPGTASGKRVYVAQRDVAGRTRRVTIDSVAVLPLEDARKRARDLLAEMGEGADPNAEKRAARTKGQSLQDALDAFLAAKEAQQRRPASIAYYRYNVEFYLKDWLAKPIADITPEMVERRFAKIVEEVQARPRKGERAQAGFFSGASTANGTMRSLRAVWNFTRKRDSSLGDNPVQRLSGEWHEEPERESVLRPTDMPAFWRALAGYPERTQRDYLLLLLYTGMRRGEAAGLRWADVDFGEKVIRVDRKRTKGGRSLTLPMSDLVHDLLVARRALGHEGPFVFASASETGHLVEPRAALEAIAKTTGIRSTVGTVITPHDLRRTFLTQADETDISFVARKTLVGHAVGDITGRYTRVSEADRATAMQKIADRYKALCKMEVPAGNVVALNAEKATA